MLQLRSYTLNLSRILNLLGSTRFNTEEHQKAITLALKRSKELTHRVQERTKDEENKERLRKTLKKMSQKKIKINNLDQTNNLLLVCYGTAHSGFDDFVIKEKDPRVYLLLYKTVLFVSIEKNSKLKIASQINLKHLAIDDSENTSESSSQISVANTQDKTIFTINLVSYQEKMQLLGTINPLVALPEKREENGILWEGNQVIGGKFEALLQLLLTLDHWEQMKDPFFFNYRSNLRMI